jgi:predicted dehydrogenase
MIKDSHPDYLSDRNISRRRFLGYGAATTAALSTSWLGPRTATAGEKLRLGVIGCGWYGMVDLNAAFGVGGVECIALCDVDTAHLEESAAAVQEKQGYRPQTFKNYQELLNMPGLQAVIIATPPHWHALPFIAALAKGLDVYCEKPIAYDIREGQAMVEAAERSNQIIQIGFQRRQSRAIAAARDYILNGGLGKIIQVDVQIHYSAKMLDATPQNPPSTLDWDLWCGPAPKLPYSPQIGHKSWRLEKEYGNGHLVDWGIHLIDATRWILNETMPNAVQAAGGIYFHKGFITTPDILTAHFDFATCPVTWRHRLWGAVEYTPDISNGILFYGEKGSLFVTDRRWVVIPREAGKEKEIHETDNDMAVEHMADFLQSVQTRKPPTCSPRDSFHSTATVQLGMIAYAMGEKISWNMAEKKIIGNDKAAKLLKRPYRSSWKHPYVGA